VYYLGIDEIGGNVIKGILQVKTFLTKRYFWLWLSSLLTLCAVVNALLPRIKPRPEYHSLIGHLLGGLSIYDASNYFNIALNGYPTSPNALKAFFPLFPLLLGVLSASVTWFLSSLDGLILTATVLNVAFFGAALVLLGKLVETDYGSEISRRSRIMILLWPFSFFFIAPYTESLFLFLSVAAVYAARRGRWVASGLLVGLAGLTRLAGVLLIAVLLAEMAFGQESFRRKPLIKILALALGLFGTLSYFLYLAFFKGGLATYFLAYKEGWPDRHVDLNVINTILKPIFGYISDGSIGLNSLLSFVILVMATVSVLLAVRYKLRRSYLVMMVAAFILPLVSGDLAGLGRYYMVVFPMFICFSLFFNKHGRLFWPVMVASALLGCALMSLFISGIFVG
jgi:hypothetical protein